MISNVRLHELYPSPVLMFDVNVDIEEAFEETMRLGNTWTDKLLNWELEGTVLQQIYKIKHEQIVLYKEKYNLPGEVTLGASWRVWQEYGERESAHFHLGGFFSSIVYLKTPEGGGDLMVLDPRGPVCWNMFNTETFDVSNGGGGDCRIYTRIKPYPGLVVIMPSWLIHYSEQNLSQDPRSLIASDWTLTGWQNVQRTKESDRVVKKL
jgi:hypothetical protein